MAYPVPAGYKAALLTSGAPSLRVESWLDGEKVAQVYPVDGSVTIDRTRATRATVAATFKASRYGNRLLAAKTIAYADATALWGTYGDAAVVAQTYGELSAPQVTSTTSADPLVPGPTTASVLSPYGVELKVWRSTRYRSTTYPATYADAAAAWATYADAVTAASGRAYGEPIPTFDGLRTVDVPLGVFRIVDVTVDDGGADITVTVDGDDRSYLIARNGWDKTYTIPAGTNAVTAIKAMAQDRYPAIEFADDIDPSTFALPAAYYGIETDGNPWADIQALADSAGMRVWFNANGELTIKNIVATSDVDPIQAVSEASGNLIRTTRSLGTREVANRVTVIGENSTIGAVRATATDTLSGSPTNISGSFGVSSKTVRSSLVGSQAQALAAAVKEIEDSRGGAETVNWQMVPDPSIEPGDVIQANLPSQRLTKNVLVDSVVIPFNPTGLMDLTGRSIQEATSV